jgi:predicted helicase
MLPVAPWRLSCRPGANYTKRRSYPQSDQTREDKLAIIAKSENIYSPKIELSKMEPNEHGDWLNQRTDFFSTILPLGDKDDKTNEHTVFAPFYSNGLKTNRDT